MPRDSEQSYLHTFSKDKLKPNASKLCILYVLDIVHGQTKQFCLTQKRNKRTKRLWKHVEPSVSLFLQSNVTQYGYSKWEEEPAGEVLIKALMNWYWLTLCSLKLI
jgi:hypothetical protein